MILGTPGFIGQRLREARLERAMLVRTLAERVGVSNTTIYGYEKGEASPRPEVFKDFCIALDMPAQHFLVPIEEQPGGAVYYRANRSTAVAACDAAEARLTWLHRLGVVVGQYVTLPSVNLPRFELPVDPLALSTQKIEQLAAETRRHWGLGLGPISNVVGLLERFGLLVARTEVDADSLDGVSRFFPDRPAVLLAANKRSGPRSRFDAAHELAHLILHRNIDPVRLNKPSEWKQFETQAHTFAGAFLFPPEAFRSEIRALSLDGFLALKMRWRVSIGMMMMQAKRLALARETVFTRLHINYARRGYQANGEPYDNEIPPEQPRLLARALEVWASATSHNDVCENVPFGIRDMIKLTGVARGVLTGETAKVLVLAPSSPSSSSPLTDSKVGIVLPLRTPQ